MGPWEGCCCCCSGLGWTKMAASADIVPHDILLALSSLTDDNFLTAWDTSLELLSKKRKQGGKSHLYYTVNESKDEADLQAEMLCHVLESLMQKTIPDEELVSVLSSIGLQRDRANLFVSQCNQLQEIISRKVHDSPREQLVDLRWKFGVVAGSSLEGEAGRTFVQVKLVSLSPDGTLTPRHVEMSLQKFYDFLHQLEKAKASLEYMNY